MIFLEDESDNVMQVSKKSSIMSKAAREMLIICETVFLKLELTKKERDD